MADKDSSCHLPTQFWSWCLCASVCTSNKYYAQNTTWLITYTLPPAQLCRLLATYLVPTRIRVDPNWRFRQRFFSETGLGLGQIEGVGLDFRREEPLFQNSFCLQPCKENFTIQLLAKGIPHVNWNHKWNVMPNLPGHVSTELQSAANAASASAPFGVVWWARKRWGEILRAAWDAFRSSMYTPQISHAIVLFTVEPFFSYFFISTIFTLSLTIFIF